ncbi:glycosyltransferase family 4 protein [Jannaschia sp. W003]|uniref:glycosyltransferase family 4 protein n=1 Tax=Jannaschia sp. W003 TaxID=2867012 RepID=UPI0021A4F7AE|nr:glycosyltransferase family 4 protein [Jannaschia sp. W003]UWQ23193.1 glycosyltransferase family 4 protein [Jannaschia sp. W003]
MARPHILFVANGVLGWSTYARQLETALAARGDVRATVLHRSPPRWAMQAARRHADGPLARRLRPFDPIRLHAGPLGRDLRRAVAEARPDVVHVAAHWPAGALDGAVPFTLALDATRPGITRDMPLPGWRPREWEAEAALCRRAAHLFPMSGWAAASLRDDFGVAPGRITVQPPALDPGAWPPEAEGSGAREMQVVFIGNDVARKGLARLAAWVRGPLAGRVHLHVVSTDPRAPGSDAHVTAHGAVPHARLMAELLPRMDAACLPTRLDMSPFVLAETQAAGLPAVASRLGGIPDLVEDGRTGLLCPPGDDAAFVDALGALADDPARRRRMGRTARERAGALFDGRRNFDRLIDTLAAIARGDAP